MEDHELKFEGILYRLRKLLVRGTPSSIYPSRLGDMKSCRVHC
jgi:hypothetical protein